MPGQPLMPMLTGALNTRKPKKTAQELLGSPILADAFDNKGEEMAVEKTQHKETDKKPSADNISAMNVNEPEVGDKKLVDENKHENTPAKWFNVKPDEKTFANLDFTPPSWGEAKKKQLLLDISLSPIVGNAKMSQADGQHPNQVQAVVDELPDCIASMELNRSMSEADFVDWIDNDDS